MVKQAYLLLNCAETMPDLVILTEGPTAGTFYLSIQRRDGQEALRFYLLDSGNEREHGSYVPPSDKVLTWLKNQLFDETGMPSAVPSIVFQHIPLIEYRECRDVTINEPICSPDINTGEFELLWSNGNVMAVFCGHDHKNDFVGHLDGIDLGYTPSCGFACYGPGVDRGGRQGSGRAECKGTEIKQKNNRSRNGELE